MSKEKNEFVMLDSEFKERAEKVIHVLGMEGFKVQKKGSQIQFKKDFKVLTVPIALIDSGNWTDIHHLYRSVCSSSPQVENYAAQNEWSRWTKK